MWVDRISWQALNDRTVAAEAVRAQLDRHNTALEASLDWMRVRLTQLEHERAQLIYQLLGIKVPVPEIAQAPKPSRTGFDSPLNETISFEDVGDEVAAKLGISHNADGTLRYSSQ